VSEGAWIFLSHSHKDFGKVREIRNELEAQKHHPLLFFLKCLDDDSEIDSLIRREIEARSWFILCNSQNSRKSRWVQEERKIIAGLSSHTSATVDLDDSIPSQLSSISGLTKRASVFLSYASADQEMAGRIENALRANDFGVFSDLQIAHGNSWQTSIKSAMDSAVERGSVLVLLSRSSLTSQWQQREILLALKHAEPGEGRRNIIPIFLNSPEHVLEAILPAVRSTLRGIKSFDFSTGEFTEKMTDVKYWLRNFEWRL
jgi:hypothetical protein